MTTINVDPVSAASKTIFHSTFLC